MLQPAGPTVIVLAGLLESKQPLIEGAVHYNVREEFPKSSDTIGLGPRVLHPTEGVPAAQPALRVNHNDQSQGYEDERPLRSLAFSR